MKRSLLALLLLSFPVATRAQAPRPAPRCTDTLAGARWRVTPLDAAVTDPAPGDHDRDRYMASLLQKLGMGYRDPNASRIHVEGQEIITMLESRTPVAAGMDLILDQDGKVIDARISQSSGNAGVDSALLVAARDAEHGRGYGRPPRGLRRDSLRITIRVADRDLPPDAVRVGGIASAHLEANVAPRIRNMPPARAPRSKRGKEVVLSGRVDQHGRMLPASIRVVSTTDSSLIAIARKSMEGTTFYPGTYNGCPAESSIRFPFKF